jgi:UDP-N-acetylmuramate--alanine ligase
VETVGLGDFADWVATDWELGTGTSRFAVCHGGLELGRLTIRLPGAHSVLNALMVVAVLSRLGYDFDQAAGAVREFTGVSRRLEVKYERSGITVIDDYAHHPAEIRATLSSIRSTFPGSRIWCVFQPHQASRTRFLLREFAAALTGADRVLVPDIYFARDSREERRRISSFDLVKKVMNLGTHARYLPDFEDIVERLMTGLRPRDVLVTMGAGDVFKVADDVADRMKDYGEASIPA